MRYVEQCLWDYRQNLTLIEDLRAELSNMQSVQGQDYNGNSGNGISNPVFEVTARIITLEKKIVKILKRTRPVERLSRTLWSVNTLSYSHMSSILRLRYFRHHSVYKVIREMAISQPTYWRRNEQLLKMAREYLNADG